MQDASDIVIDDYETQIADAKATAKERVSAFMLDSKEQVVKGAEEVMRVAKENPRTAIAAGAAVVVGAVAAVAIPVIRAATKTKPKSRTATAAKRTPARKPAAKTAAKKTTTRRSSAKSGTPAHA